MRYEFIDTLNNVLFRCQSSNCLDALRKAVKSSKVVHGQNVRLYTVTDGYRKGQRLYYGNFDQLLDYYRDRIKVKK